MTRSKKSRPPGAAPGRPASESGAAAALLAVLVAVALAVGVGAFLGLGGSVDATQDTPLPALRDQVVPVSAAAFAGVALGAPKEKVLAQLRPAQPVTTRVIDEFEQRSPETVAAECIYYEKEQATSGELFRFCFVRDELVDKTVAYPDEASSSAGAERIRPAPFFR